MASQVWLQLFILAYNLGNFLRWLALGRAILDWSLRSPSAEGRSVQVKLIKIGGRLVFQLAEVAVAREVFAALLQRIGSFALAPG